MIRTVQLNDAEEICDIYNYYVMNTAISFEEAAVSVEEMKGRIKKVLLEYPWFVYEIDGRIAGYAYATRWKARSAYRYTLESTVYIDGRHKGKGIGTSLYKHLLKDLEDRGCHSAIGVITIPNPGSIALHEKCGFKKAAHFKEVGYKHQRWIDVGYWQYNFDKENIYE